MGHAEQHCLASLQFWKVAKPAVFASGVYWLMSSCPKKPLSFELLGFSSKPHPGWVGSVFRLASVCHWERKTKTSFCHRDDKKKARLAGNGAVTGPWVCAFNQHCLLSHRVLPGKETTSLNKKLEDDQQTTKGSWSFPEKAAAGQNRETDTLNTFSSPISLYKVDQSKFERNRTNRNISIYSSWYVYVSFLREKERGNK